MSTASKVWGVIGGLGFLAAGAFLYLPSGVIAPSYGVVVLWAVWLVLAWGAVVLLRARRPGRLVLVAVVSVILWFTLVMIGSWLFHWNA